MLTVAIYVKPEMETLKLREASVTEASPAVQEIPPEPVPHRQIQRAAEQGWSTKAFGAAVATLLATIGQNLSAHHTVGNVMVWMSPTVAMMIPPACNYALERWGERLENKYYSEARKNLVTLLDNPETSERHKKEMRLTLEKAETAWALKQIERAGRRKKES